MADQNTLTSQQPKEKARNAAVFDPVFGGFELDSFLNQAVKLATRGEGDLVNEAPVTPNLEQISQMPEHKVEVGRFSPEGSITGFQNPRTLVDTSPEARISSLEAEQFRVWRQHLAKAPLEEKRVNINELNALQVLYQGTVDDEGNVTKYHQTEADKKQSENIALSIQREREEKLAAIRTGPNRKSSKAAVSGVTTDMLLRADEHEGRSATSSSGGMTHGG